MSAHTPGWTVDEDDSRDGVDFIPITAPGLVVAEVYGSADDLSITDEDRKRARLISAAPDLLEAAREGLIAAEADVEARRWELDERFEGEAEDTLLPVLIARRDKIAAAIARATLQDGGGG